MCFHDPQDHEYNRFWARHVLRLDIDLWTSIINESALFNAHGRPVSSEWVSWTHNAKTITFGKAATKNRCKYSMFCCNSIIFPPSGVYTNDASKDVMDV